MITRTARRLTAVTAGALAAVLLTSCAGGAQPEPAEDAPAADAVTIDDVWVKAADEGMTSAFGVLRNAAEEPVTVVEVRSPISPMELHETVENEAGEMLMRETTEFSLPAGGEFLLEPGGNHFMLMDLAEPVRPGDEVAFTIVFDDDSTLDFSAVAKEYGGAQEHYVPGEEDEHEGHADGAGSDSDEQHAEDEHDGHGEHGEEGHDDE
ncbi:copper chaperone PCu(A)C [Sediminivirga luteola]|uniref:Copper chaperone PCu(A)C n=1 Tax=Sediminivirga luteola TaxID=1774748 RepID=A0A8J2TVR2_9MICO|nr:copper chaperone PCu(A)C [Sediminivirga luteola]GGA04957.1 hypothetical protein GCM10011333_04520 [Sediminivirga luteola]